MTSSSYSLLEVGNDESIPLFVAEVGQDEFIPLMVADAEVEQDEFIPLIVAEVEHDESIHRVTTLEWPSAVYSVQSRLCGWSYLIKFLIRKVQMPR